MKRQTIILSTLLMLCISIATSCEQDKVEQPESLNTLTVKTEGSLTFAYDATDDIVIVTVDTDADEQFTQSIEYLGDVKDWVIISAVTRTGFTIGVTANDVHKSSRRAAEIKVNAGNAKEQILTVIQNGEQSQDILELTYDTEDVEFTWDDNKKLHFVVETNSVTGWSVKAVDAVGETSTWVTVERSEEEEDEEGGAIPVRSDADEGQWFRVSLSNYNTVDAAPRTAFIKVNAGDADEQEIQITQMPRPTTLELEYDPIVFTWDDQRTIEVKVKTNSSMSYTAEVDDEDDWVVIDIQDMTTFTIGVENFEPEDSEADAQERTATVRVNVGRAQEQTITITQTSNRS